MAYPLWEYVDRWLYQQRMTQKDFVARTGVSAMTLNRLKTQSRPPKAETVQAIADAVGLDHDEAGILAGRLRPTAEQAPSVRDAIEADQDLTPESRRALLDVYEQLTAANTARIHSVKRRPPNGDGHSDDAQVVI